MGKNREGRDVCVSVGRMRGSRGKESLRYGVVGWGQGGEILDGTSQVRLVHKLGL